MTEPEICAIETIKELSLMLDSYTLAKEVPIKVLYEARVLSVQLSFMFKAIQKEGAFSSEFVIECAKNMGPFLRPLFLLGGLDGLTQKINSLI